MKIANAKTLMAKESQMEERTKMTQNTLTATKGHWEVCERWADAHGITISHVFRLMIEHLSDCKLTRDGVFLKFEKRSGGHA